MRPPGGNRVPAVTAVCGGLYRCRRVRRVTVVPDGATLRRHGFLLHRPVARRLAQPPTTPKRVRAEAKVCKHCRHRFDDPAAAVTDRLMATETWLIRLTGDEEWGALGGGWIDHVEKVADLRWVESWINAPEWLPDRDRDRIDLDAGTFLYAIYKGEIHTLLGRPPSDQLTDEWERQLELLEALDSDFATRWSGLEGSRRPRPQESPVPPRASIGRSTFSPTGPPASSTCWPSTATGGLDRSRKTVGRWDPTGRCGTRLTERT